MNVRYQIENINRSQKHHLGLSSAIPMFDVEFRQGKKSATFPAYIDSGAKAVHARIPKKVADDLGIEPTGTATLRSSSGTKEVSIGIIDYISITKKCTVANGKIVIGGEEEASLGQPFLAATGATLQHVQGKLRMVCSQEASPIGVYPQFNFDLKKGNRQETITAILDTGFSGGVSLTAALAKKLGLEKSSEVDVEDASGTKWKAGIASFDRVSFSGYPKCAVEKLEAYIYPENTNPPILVGRKFLNGMAGGSYLGYDADGAWAGCEAEESKIRAAKSVYVNTVPRESLPDGAKPTVLAVASSSPAWIPFAVGATAVAGLTTWLLLNKK